MSRMPDRLAVLMNGSLVGHVRRSGSRLSFAYADEWRASDAAVPLSLSMPLGATEHGHDAISHWMWGLLPDNERVLARIASMTGVSANSAFALLWRIGEDCPGAVQFVEESRQADIIQGGDVKWLDEQEVAERLASLRQNTTGRRQSEGQFSLAGAQPKTALVLVDGRWGIPSGRVPTTHILKPPMQDLEGHAENEVFCLALAHRLGMRAAKAEVMRFGNETAIVVERFDRFRSPGGDILRVHQEDVCQALGVHPAGKYESDGGPGIRRIAELLAFSSNPEVDRRRFMQAIAFNFLIAGTDAHAKNYALLFAPRQVRLAPLYDVASYLPYADRFADVRMPMKVDRYDRYSEIFPRHWERMAKACSYPAEEAVRHVTEFAEAMPDAAKGVAQELRSRGVDHPVLEALVEKLGKRAESVLRTWRLRAPSDEAEAIETPRRG